MLINFINWFATDGALKFNKSLNAKKRVFKF